VIETVAVVGNLTLLSTMTMIMILKIKGERHNNNKTNRTIVQYIIYSQYTTSI